MMLDLRNYTFRPNVAILWFHTFIEENIEVIMNSVGSSGRDLYFLSPISTRTPHTIHNYIYIFLYKDVKPEDGHVRPKHVVS
jgi:hypothetical protein